MILNFATCERRKALEYIQQVLPSREIADTPESAGPLLDFVEQDIVRVQDPFMYGNRIQVTPGKNWVEDFAVRQKIVDACLIFQPEGSNEALESEAGNE